MAQTALRSSNGSVPEVLELKGRGTRDSRCVVGLGTLRALAGACSDNNGSVSDSAEFSSTEYSMMMQKNLFVALSVIGGSGSR